MTFAEEIDTFRNRSMCPMTPEQFDESCDQMAQIIIGEIDREAVNILMKQKESQP